MLTATTTVQALHDFVNGSDWTIEPARFYGPGISKRYSREDLCHLFAAMGYRRGAEVGVWEGEFSEHICRANPGVELLCVDPWEWYPDYVDPKNDRQRLEVAYRTACDRLAPFKVTIRRETSVQAAAKVPDGSLDFVYLDGNHAAAFVRADLEAWSPKVRSGGIIAGHDYSTRRKHIAVVPAVDAFTAERQIAPWFVLAKEKAPSFFWVQP